jgi:3-hydroxyacyl-[acyl-carrier-protein] dehydratase
VNDTIIPFEEIKKVLPHRYPFLLVDRVLSVDATSIRAIKNVTANEPFFMGHFPGVAVMPGVLQIEAMAQTAGLILAQSDGFAVKTEIAYLAGVDNAKFKRVVTPGDQLLIEAKVIAQKRTVLKVAAAISVDGEMASTADIVLVVKPLSSSVS